MKPHPDHCYAVITGDIVGSSKLPAAERKNLPALIRNEGKRLCALWPERLPVPPEVFRGDGWQWLVKQPVFALRTGLTLRLRLRALLSGKESDSRISVGIGTVDFLPPRGITGGDGEAFRLSGRGLEQMAASRRTAVCVRDEQPFLDGALSLLDELVGRWTKKQGLAVAGALEGLTQQKIAREWIEPVSQPAIGKQLESAGWGRLEDALDRIEEGFEGIIIN